MDRLDFFFRQLVTEDEMDEAFDNAEQADRDLASTMELIGIVAGGAASEKAGVPDLSIDVAGNAIAYDKQGRRLTWVDLQSVPVDQEDGGAPTTVATPGNERWLTVYAEFAEDLQDARLDGNDVSVFFRRNESFRLFVAMAAEQSIGTDDKPPVRSDALIVCDVRLVNAQTAVLDADIDITRRENFLRIAGTPNSIVASTPKDALEQIFTLLNTEASSLAAFVAALANTGASPGASLVGLQAHSVTPTGGNPLRVLDETLQLGVQRLINDLTSTAAADGASRVGLNGFTAGAVTVATGSAHSGLVDVATALNAYRTQIATTTGPSGATLVGIQGETKTPTGGNALGYSSTDLRTAIGFILDGLVSSGSSDGASRVGAKARATANFSLATGNVGSQLDGLLAAAQTAFDAASDADAIGFDGHAGAASFTAPAYTLPASSVEAGMDSLLNEINKRVAKAGDTMGGSLLVNTAASHNLGSVGAEWNLAFLKELRLSIEGLGNGDIIRGHDGAAVANLPFRIGFRSAPTSGVNPLITFTPATAVASRTALFGAHILGSNTFNIGGAGASESFSTGYIETLVAQGQDTKGLTFVGAISGPARIERTVPGSAVTAFTMAMRLAGVTTVDPLLVGAISATEGLLTTHHMRPAATALYGLGTDTLRYTDLYLTNASIIAGAIKSEAAQALELGKSGADQDILRRALGTLEVSLRMRFMFEGSDSGGTPVVGFIMGAGAHSSRTIVPLTATENLGASGVRWQSVFGATGDFNALVANTSATLNGTVILNDGPVVNGGLTVNSAVLTANVGIDTTIASMSAIDAINLSRNSSILQHLARTEVGATTQLLAQGIGIDFPMRWTGGEVVPFEIGIGLSGDADKGAGLNKSATMVPFSDGGAKLGLPGEEFAAVRTDELQSDGFVWADGGTQDHTIYFNATHFVLHGDAQNQDRFPGGEPRANNGEAWLMPIQLPPNVQVKEIHLAVQGNPGDPLPAGFETGHNLTMRRAPWNAPGNIVVDTVTDDTNAVTTLEMLGINQTLDAIPGTRWWIRYENDGWASQVTLTGGKIVYRLDEPYFGQGGVQ